MTVKFKKLHYAAVKPKRATPQSAGADLFACLESNITIKSGERHLVPTGIAAEIPAGFGGLIFPRSSLATKYGVSLSNCVGVVDADYRGEIKIPLINHSGKEYTIRPGDRLAQLVVMPIEFPDFEECESLSTSQRGAGGFGSTGR
jgi:dUTP pyrophosphatase